VGGVTDDQRIDAEIRGILDQLPLSGTSGTLLREQMHAAAAGGKRFRPKIVLQSYRAFAPAATESHALWQVAAGYEILHAAFVVHDDIIDQDIQRRGRLNVRGSLAEGARLSGADASNSTQIGDAGALLVGDLLLYAATRAVMTADADASTRARLVEQFDEALAVSAVGEWEDASRLGADRDSALDMTANKTAVYSFAAPLRAGAALAGADTSVEPALTALARQLGIAFQLADDLIGAFGSETQAGRESGADLRQGKNTPLVALARESKTWPEVEGALSLANTGPVAVLRAQQVLESSGARAQLSTLLREHLTRARDLAATLPAGIAKLVDDAAAEIESRMP